MTVRKRKGNNSSALIIFTREPEAGVTKTRMMPYFTAEQSAELHRCMLRDIGRQAQAADADIIVAYAGGEPSFLLSVFSKDRCRYIKQRGEGLGSRMENAVSDALGLGYSSAVLIGTDIPEIEAESIDAAFAMLGAYDCVIGPTEDGGYYLIGMKSVHHEAFDIGQYSTDSVCAETVASLKRAGLCVGYADTYADMDTPGDLAGFRRRMREDRMLRHSCTGRMLAAAAKISVIVPVYNESAEIGRMTEQLSRMAGGCEVIFVDGGSSDDTADKIKEAGEDFMLLTSDKGRGVQMNAGALAAGGDVLFFLHCDSILPENCMDEIRRVMSAYDWGCFGVRFPSRNLFMMTNRIISNHRALFRQLPFGDQGIFIDRTLFMEMGMFDPLPLMEDYAFSLKMRRYGIRPGMARRRIISSARRYGTGTADILSTELKMWELRRQYRKGVPSDQLQEQYRDIR